MKITKRQLRRIIREAMSTLISTDPQEVADLLQIGTEIGEKLDYDGLLQIANREAGADVSVYVEPAIQLLVDDGVFEITPDQLYTRIF